MLLTLHLAFKPWSIQCTLFICFLRECKLHSSRACFLIFLIFFHCYFKYCCLINTCGMSGWISQRPGSPEGQAQSWPCCLHDFPTQPLTRRHLLTSLLLENQKFIPLSLFVFLQTHLLVPCKARTRQVLLVWLRSRVWTLLGDQLHCGNCRFFHSVCARVSWGLLNKEFFSGLYWGSRVINVLLIASGNCRLTSLSSLKCKRNVPWTSVTLPSTLSVQGA